MVEIAHQKELIRRETERLYTAQKSLAEDVARGIAARDKGEVTNQLHSRFYQLLGKLGSSLESRLNGRGPLDDRARVSSRRVHGSRGARTDPKRLVAAVYRACPELPRELA